MTDWRRLIRDVPDFPKPGILFRDITPLLGDAAGFAAVIDALAETFKANRISRVVAVESRGFVFGAPLAIRLGAGFVPVRKPGKLPAKAARVTYDLEYGTGTLEMHDDALSRGERVLVLDDLLATGGTAEAAAELVRGRGAEVVAFGFVVELEFLKGRGRLERIAPVRALVQY